MIISRVAEVVGRNEGPSSKSLDLEKTLSTNTRYFAAILRFVTIHALFERLLAFWGQNMGKNCTISWFILHIVLN